MAIVALCSVALLAFAVRPQTLSLHSLVALLCLPFRAERPKSRYSRRVDLPRQSGRRSPSTVRSKRDQNAGSRQLLVRPFDPLVSSNHRALLGITMGDCAGLESSCNAMDDEERGRLAYRLTQCHMASLGEALGECTAPALHECTSKLSERAITAFTVFMPTVEQVSP